MDESIRDGSADDVDVVLEMLDDAVVWLSRSGRTGQWGDRPWSENPAAASHLFELISRGKLLVLERDGRAASAAVYGGEPPVYVERSDDPEFYVQLLVTAAWARGTGAGRRLLDEIARRAGIEGCSHLRVDCWGGGDRKLVRYYEGAGFHTTDVFEHNGWPGQVLEMTLTAD